MIRIFAVIFIAGLIAFCSAILNADFHAAVTARSAEPTPTPKSKSDKSKNVRDPVLIDGEFDGSKIIKSDSQWKKELTPNEFYVLREEGTERPFSGELDKNKRSGTYHCAACGLVLFNSKHKFDSGTGWPSFFQVAFKKNLMEKEDRSIGEARIEVECARCGSHLGHVFDDGPEPTGLRYCMNSVALKFKAAK